MQTQEIVRLTRQTIPELLKLRAESLDAPARARGDRRGAARGEAPDLRGDDRRRSKVRDRRRFPLRWPSSGMVELSLAGSEGRTLSIGECTDLNCAGLGLTAEHSFAVGTVVDFSCHLPEMTICGRATVMRCEEVNKAYQIGIAFLFDE